MNDFWTYLQTSLSTGNAEVTTATVVVTMLLSVVVGSLIYLVYRFFSKGVLYDRRFNVTLPLMTIVSTMIILCVSSNLAFSLGALGALICLWRILSISDLSELLTQGGLTSLAGDTFRLYLAMLACLLVLAVSFSRAAPQPVHSSLGGRPLSGRTKLASVLSLLLVPLTIFIGIVYFGKKSYGVVSILVLLECMAPFALIFEGRKPKARELVLIAALCALAVAGRAALFMLPGFKPVAALVILSGVAFGGETGFLVGAMSMLTSNVLFGQGPWTPFQMFAMGLIGFLAGVSFQKGLLRAGRAPLAIFGAVSVVLVYGGIMNPASAILYQPNLSLSVLKAYYLTGFPFDLVHAAATALFLWFGAEPMLAKLERVKRKYGLTEAE